MCSGLCLGWPALLAWAAPERKTMTGRCQEHQEELGEGERRQPVTRGWGQPAVASETPVLLFSIAKIKDSLHHGKEEGIHDPREEEEAQDSAP